jgi:hypothetical protein
MFGKIGISSSIEQLQNETKPLQISWDTIHITSYKKCQRSPTQPTQSSHARRPSVYVILEQSVATATKQPWVAEYHQAAVLMMLAGQG